MARIRLAMYVAVFCLCFAAESRCEEPQKVSVCELQKDPAAYNHKLVAVTAFVSHDFEDFTLFDPACDAWPAVWLEYGGKAKSDTMYCCGPTNGKSRPEEMKIEDIPIPLTDNELFRQFDKEIQPPFRSGKYGSEVHADLVGRFFSGKKEQFGKGEPFWGGYGHMGCCSLLAIQEVKQVSPQDRDDLDYGASYDQPDLEKAGCGFNFLTPIMPGSELLDAQKQAERDPSTRAFDDPERVASDFLIAQLKLQDSGSLALKQIRKVQSRVVFEWQQASKTEKYMVVVSRPYLLSYYAENPERVAWVVVAAYVSSCGKGNSVSRIH